MPVLVPLPAEKSVCVLSALASWLSCRKSKTFSLVVQLSIVHSFKKFVARSISALSLCFNCSFSRLTSNFKSRRLARSLISRHHTACSPPTHLFQSHSRTNGQQSDGYLLNSSYNRHDPALQWSTRRHLLYQQVCATIHNPVSPLRNTAGRSGLCCILV